jgi:hypothetical protein
MTTTYLAVHVLEQLAQAQAVVDRHLTVGVDGRCLTCGQPEPCETRSRASAVFAGTAGCLTAGRGWHREASGERASRRAARLVLRRRWSRLAVRARQSDS